MRVTMLCLVCSISLLPSIQWTMIFWRSACRGRTGSARPRLIGFAPISAIADRRSSSMGSSQLSALSAVASLMAPCSGRCCSCSPLPYTADFGELAASLGLSSHFYADDSQLYTWGPPSTVVQQRRRMELGVERIAEWMRSNRLRLNPEKTDFLQWCATHRRCIHLDTAELSVCGALILPLTSVRDLGVLLESDRSMRRHVAWTVGCCFRQLRLIRSCIKSLPLGAAKAAVVAFVTSRVDRYKSLLAGAPARLLDGLQSVLSAAARLVCNKRKYDHVTPLLRDVLHWLPVPFRIEYKLCLLVFLSLHGAAPEYLRDCCAGTDSSASVLRLRSLERTDLRVRRMKTHFGDRAFSAAGPQCWNSLPPVIRFADSVDSFKAQLKTHLFVVACKAPL